MIYFVECTMFTHLMLLCTRAIPRKCNCSECHSEVEAHTEHAIIQVFYHTLKFDLRVLYWAPFLGWGNSALPSPRAKETFNSST